MATDRIIATRSVGTPTKRSGESMRSMASVMASGAVQMVRRLLSTSSKKTRATTR